MPRRLIHKIHHYAGLISGLFLLIMGLTGAVLVFHEEIDRWQFDQQFDNRETTSNTVNLDAIVQQTIASYPGWGIRLMHLDKPFPPYLPVRVQKGDKRRMLLYGKQNASLVSDRDAHGYLVYNLLKLHYQLFAGTVGKVVILLVGLLFMVTLGSGVWALHKKLWQILTLKVKPEWPLTLNGLWKLHVVAGVWLVFFYAVIALSGTIIAWRIVSADSAKDDAIPVSQTSQRLHFSLSASMEQITEQYPRFIPVMVNLTPGAQWKVVVRGATQGRPGFIYYASNSLLLDSNDGSIAKEMFWGQLTAGQKFYFMVLPAHFGGWGGWASKLLYALLGILLPLLIVTGYWMWLKKGAI